MPLRALGTTRFVKITFDKKLAVAMILHVCTYEEWQMYNVKNNYMPAAYQRDGFIHCCTDSQLIGVLTRYYKEKTDLLLLHIDENLLSSPVKWEESTGGEKFPHVYGPIDKHSILKTERIDSETWS
jgi:uncharacterized protein (DUF952 family)